MEKQINDEKLNKFFDLDWKLVGNYLFYILTNSLSIIIPIIVSPILIHNYGLEIYGVLMLSQTTMLFISLFLDNGFRLYFIRQISQNREDKLIIFKSYSDYMNIKFYLSILGLILINCCILFFINSKYHQICFFSEIIFLGNILSPSFLLMGIEKFTTLSIFNAASRLIYIFGFILIIHDKNHFYINNLLFGLGYLSTALIMILFIYKKYGYKIYIKKLNTNFREIKPLILNNTFQNLEIYIHNFLIGAMATKIELGIFSAIEKLYSIFKQALITLIEILYPSACKEVSKTKKKLTKLKGLTFVVFVFLAISYIFIVNFRIEISRYLTNETGEKQESLLIFFMILPFAILLFNFKSHLELMALKLDVILSRITLLILILKIALIYLFYFHFGIVGIVFSLIITEIISGIFKQFFVNKHLKEING